MVALAAEAPAQAVSGAQMLWFKDGRLVGQATEVLTALRAADADGLHPRDYLIPCRPEALIRFSQATLTPACNNASKPLFRWPHRALLESCMAVVQLRERRGFDLPPATAKIDVAVGVRQLASSRDVSSTLASFEPPPIPYSKSCSVGSRARPASRTGSPRPSLPCLPFRIPPVNATRVYRSRVLGFRPTNRSGSRTP